MDTETARPLLTAVVATPQASGSGLYTIIDILFSVRRDWRALNGLPPKPPAFLPRIVSVDGAAMTGLNGVTLATDAALADVPTPDIVIVPDLHVDPDAPLPNSYAPLIDWLRDAHAGGAVVVGLCAGVLVLAETGLLDGCDATTHWAYADALARRRPAVRVRRERVLVPAGEGHRVITAGGASSWHDLLLYLIGRVAGAEEARRIAKLYLLQWHSEGQSPYAALSPARCAGDRAVEQAQAWAADNYAQPNPVAGMVVASGLSERSFLRRFRAAAGMAPREYVHLLRIEEAKHLLETTGIAIDKVAAEVGYAEPAAFRHGFRRKVGLSPSAYRRRFQAPALAGAH